MAEAGTIPTLPTPSLSEPRQPRSGTRCLGYSAGIHSGPGFDADSIEFPPLFRCRFEAMRDYSLPGLGIAESLVVGSASRNGAPFEQSA